MYKWRLYLRLICIDLWVLFALAWARLLIVVFAWKSIEIQTRHKHDLHSAALLAGCFLSAPLINIKQEICISRAVSSHPLKDENVSTLEHFKSLEITPYNTNASYESFFCTNYWCNLNKSWIKFEQNSTRTNKEIEILFKYLIKIIKINYMKTFSINI